LDSIRRCEDCRRIVHGEAGNACPYCGGARLRRVEDDRAHATRLHPPVFKLALAFCLGLGGMQLIALALGLSGPPAGHGTPFWYLNVVVGVGVALYAALRRNEGDFRALFVIGFGAFVISEALSVLARAYGIGALHNLGGVFRHGMLVFSSLALTAGAADGPGHTRHERVMLAAAGGFLFLAVLHLMLEFSKSDNERFEDIASILVAFSVAAYAAWVLWAERSRAPVVVDAPHLEKLLTPEKQDETKLP